MIVFPNAKINLGLRIVSKRSDGFHNLETIFYPIPIYDILEINLASHGGDEFTCSGFELNIADEQNLVMQALFLLRKCYSIPDVSIHLHKQIPVGAGLGGGSSDAAFCLMALNQFFDLNAGIDKLSKIALELGSDVPFFLHNKMLFARGRGNDFKKIDLKIPFQWLMLVFPNVFVSTRIAFSDAKPSGLSLELPQSGVDWQKMLVNDFEKSTFSRYPELGKIYRDLKHAEATYVGMSGSGSAIFAFFSKKPTSLLNNSYYFSRLIKL